MQCINDFKNGNSVTESKLPANYSAIKKDAPKKTVNVIHYNDRLVDFEKSQIITAILRFIQIISATEENDLGADVMDIEVSGDCERIIKFLTKYGTKLIYISRNFLGVRANENNKNAPIELEYRSILETDIEDMRATLKPLKLDR